jgi:hypothetical protein
MNTEKYLNKGMNNVYKKLNLTAPCLLPNQANASVLDAAEGLSNWTAVKTWAAELSEGGLPNGPS